MIIAISGKIKSGKDLSTRIITALSEYTNTRTEIEGHYVRGLVEDSQYDFQNRKMAEKLKQIVAILIDCDREQLEDQKFKETPLPEIWWYYKGETAMYPYDTPYEANKKLPLIKPTPRDLMLLVGTECGRDIIHPDVWVNAALGSYDKLKDDWIISDLRFKNEAEGVKKRDGYLIRINRPVITRTHSTKGSKHDITREAVSSHPSECDLDDYNGFNEIITNDGTIEDLINKLTNTFLKAILHETI